MDDASFVGRIERIRDLYCEIEEQRRRQRPRLDAASQRLAFETFHDEVTMALVLADVMDRADIWVIQ